MQVQTCDKMRMERLNTEVGSSQYSRGTVCHAQECIALYKISTIVSHPVIYSQELTLGVFVVKDVGGTACFQKDVFLNF